MAKKTKARKKTAAKKKPAAKTVHKAKKKAGKKAKTVKKAKTAKKVKAKKVKAKKVKAKKVTAAKKAPAKAKKVPAKKPTTKAPAKAKPVKASKAPSKPAKPKAVKSAPKPKPMIQETPTLSLAPDEAPLAETASHLPQVGDLAPEFTLVTDTGTFHSQDYLGKQNIVLYFYPKDDTPGCTKEACTFQEHLDHFTTKDTVILGVSTDDESSHAKFRNKYSLSFPLGSDIDHSVAESYGVWGEKSMYGRTYMGLTRATFLIDKTGRIAAVWPKVKVEGHSEEVQAAIANLTV